MTELEQVRSQMMAPQADEERLKQYPVKRQEKSSIPTRHGQTAIYIYEPLPCADTPQGKLPVLVNFHGGGFVKGYQAKFMVYGRILASKGACLVVDVDYRLAPEYPYPCALEEGWDVVRYLRQHSSDFGIDPDRMVLCGQSSGGNLATVLAMKMKKAGEPLPSGIISCYPPYDLYQDPAQKAQDKGIEPNDFILQGRLYNQWYVGDGDSRDIYISPVFAAQKDLEGLPPFTIIAGGEDFLCPDAMTFASLLMEAGVTVTVKKVKGAQHGFLVRRTEGHEAGNRLLFQTLKEYFSLSHPSSF